MSQSAARRPRSLALAALAAFSLIQLAGCASARPAAQDREELPGVVPGGLLLSQADIVQLRALNAMEAIERANSHLVIARTRANSPVRITQRGIGSLIQNPEILLVVDGARVNRAEQMLLSIPAQSILYIQILTGRDATLRFGSESANGVILVQTTAR